MAVSRKRLFVLAAGVAVGASLGLATLSLWPGLVRRYYLEALRREPSRLEEVLVTDGAPAARAVLEFLREPAGKQELFNLYIEEYDRCEPSLGTRAQLLRLRADPANRGVVALWQNGVSCQTWTGATGHSSFSMSNVPRSARRRERILELIGECEGLTFSPPGWEKLELQVRPVKSGSVELPVWPAEAETNAAPFPPGAPSVPDSARHACFFRVTS